MPDILHRFTIDAPRERVHELLATKEGVERWWNAHPNTGDETTLEVFFGGDNPAAVMHVVEDTPERIVWRVVDGPADWVGTTVTFALKRRPDDGTTLLFTHGDWREANEFMHGCSTNWGAYLTSLKSGAERGQFAAYPNGEMSRWS
jgi:uncharacterized protein YndB with AHSA1/START domain